MDEPPPVPESDPEPASSTRCMPEVVRPVPSRSRRQDRTDEGCGQRSPLAPEQSRAVRALRLSIDGVPEQRIVRGGRRCCRPYGGVTGLGGAPVVWAPSTSTGSDSDGRTRRPVVSCSDARRDPVPARHRRSRPNVSRPRDLIDVRRSRHHHARPIGVLRNEVRAVWTARSASDPRHGRARRPGFHRRGRCLCVHAERVDRQFRAARWAVRSANENSWSPIGELDAVDLDPRLRLSDAAVQSADLRSPRVTTSPRPTCSTWKQVSWGSTTARCISEGRRRAQGPAARGATCGGCGLEYFTMARERPRVARDHESARA